jgi:hypothetical protein
MENKSQIDHLFLRMKYYKYMNYYYKNNISMQKQNDLYKNKLQTLSTTIYPFQNKNI